MFQSKLQFELSCEHPTILAPLRGCFPLYSFLNAINPGISVSAIEISFLQNQLNLYPLLYIFHDAGF